MLSLRLRKVVAELVFLLVSLDGKGGDSGGELIIAERFQAGGGQEIRGEREIESFADCGVARFGVMEAAGLQGQHTQSIRRKLKLLADQYGVIVRVGG